MSDSLWSFTTFIWRLMTERRWWQAQRRVRIHTYLKISKQKRVKSHDLNLFVISLVTRCIWLPTPSDINPFTATKITKPPRHVLLHLKLSHLTRLEIVFAFYDQRIDRRAIIDQLTVAVCNEPFRDSQLSIQLRREPTLHFPQQWWTLLINYGRWYRREIEVHGVAQWVWSSEVSFQGLNGMRSRSLMRVSKEVTQQLAAHVELHVLLNRAKGFVLHSDTATGIPLLFGVIIMHTTVNERTIARVV